MVLKRKIDNEYFQSGFGNQQYFAELEEALRAGGIVVPLTYNDPGEGKNFVNGTVRLSDIRLKYTLMISSTGSRGYIWASIAQ